MKKEESIDPPVESTEASQHSDSTMKRKRSLTRTASSRDLFSKKLKQTPPTDATPNTIIKTGCGVENQRPHEMLNGIKLKVNQSIVSYRIDGVIDGTDFFKKPKARPTKRISNKATTPTTTEPQSPFKIEQSMPRP